MCIRIIKFKFKIIFGREFYRAFLLAVVYDVGKWADLQIFTS